MYHSITFGSKNTWDDWFLIPSSRPVFNPPKLKTYYVDIPGADGHLDMTESLTGEPRYENREGSLKFIVDNGHREWHDLYSEIMDYIHGRTMRAILEDDPRHYYEGRFTVDAWNSSPNNSTITIKYSVHPYKMERYSSLDDWEWDTLNFEIDIIREYQELVVDDYRKLEIPGTRKSVIPAFVVKSVDDESLSVRFNGVTYNLPDGTSRIPNIVMKDGLNLLEFYGRGTVSVDYRGGRL